MLKDLYMVIYDILGLTITELSLIILVVMQFKNKRKRSDK